MIQFRPITKENLNNAVQVQRELFPDYSARVNYEESIAGVSGYEYFLVYQGEQCVGISGIYSYPTDPDSAWLGWFGILAPYRRQGLGSQVLSQFEALARERGFRYARLYTDKFDNDAAIAFYKANGYTSENYRHPRDPAAGKYPVLIFSKALGPYPLVPWGNRNIDLTRQIEKQLLPGADHG